MLRNAILQTLSLNSPVNTHKGEPNTEINLIDVAGSPEELQPEPIYTKIEMKEKLLAEINKLPPEQSVVMKRRWGIGCEQLTIKEIAVEVGTTFSLVKSVEDTAIRTLKKKRWLRSYLKG